MTRLQIILAVWLLSLLVSFWAGREWRDRSCELAEAKDHIEQSHKMVEAVEQARSVEHQQNERLHEIGAAYEAKRSENESLPSTVVAQLNDGTLQLRKQWAACETSRLSDATAAAIERDALAELRRKDQGDLVRIGRDADDQVRACQETVEADRAEVVP